MSIVPSEQQLAIYDWFKHLANHRVTRKRKHLIVRARAGTGKTYTILEATNYAPERAILVCAFNKRIQEELQLKSRNPAVQCKTLHSLGFAAVRRVWPKITKAKGSERADGLALAVCGRGTPDYIVRMVSKLHTKGREINPHAKKHGDLSDLAYQFECEPDATWAAQGYDGYYVETKALEAMELAARVKPPGGIDYADMIFLPIRNRWLVPTYDLVVVDEGQDMTVAQLEMAQGVCRGRIVVVGDNKQAIYGFRGADSNSLDRLKDELDADELGLNVTYRCGHQIVALAAELVPDIMAWDKSPQGVISSVGLDKLNDTVAHGDFILSRLNAPLIMVAMSLLKDGKRARIAGRDIGAGLKSLIKRLKGRNEPPLMTFLNSLERWRATEVERWTIADRPDRIDFVNDQSDMIHNLADNVETIKEVETLIDGLFTDDGLGAAGVITCSSVHRAKGLEADRVFILEHTLRSHTQEELNIRYVAITRAKRELVWVTLASAPVVVKDEVVNVAS